MVRASIIIPVYNAAAYIVGTLRSAQEQSERDTEILVIDDHSTDETVALVTALTAADPRVRLLRTERNGGPSAARNRGLDAASGEWVVLLDADDAMEPQRVATLIALGEAREADMVADNVLLVSASGQVPVAPMIPPSLLGVEQPLGLAEFIARNVGSARYPRVSYGFLKPVIRRAFLDRHAIRYDEKVRFAEDFAFYVRCLHAGAAWWLTPLSLYRYLVRTNSLTEIQTSSDLDHLRKRQRALLAEPRVRADAVLRAAVRRHLWVIDRCYYYRAFTDAVKARQTATAARLLLESPRSASLILLESSNQAPTILAKALRGGYTRRGRSASA